jgi:predicted transposase/invertase (TIGR01784 family)
VKKEADSRRYNVEMQVRRYRAWSARSAYYLARTLTQQLNGGDDYGSLNPAIGIHLLDFELFTAPAHQHQAVWCFELRDRIEPSLKLGDELELNLIELPKADRLGAGEPAVVAWITFLEHWQEDRTMAQIDYPPVQQAMEHLKRLSADEETRRLALVRERALRDERSELKGAKAEGRLEGEIAVLERQLSKRFGPLGDDVRARLAAATFEELESWAERVLEAPTIEAVFR